MCRALGVSRTGFHNWERRAPSDMALQDAWLTVKIKRIHDASRGVYGSLRIHAELRLEHEVRVGEKRRAVDESRRYLGRQAEKPLEDDDPDPRDHPAADLVERDFNPSGPNVLWVADITYLRTGEGWLYVAAV
jgi:transposase InsO family protein